MLPVRPLTAIVAADVPGYFRLMRADEEGTHGRLRGLLRALIEPRTAEYRGRIVKNTGDGFLAEFLPDKPRSFAILVRVMRGTVSAGS